MGPDNRTHHRVLDKSQLAPTHLVTQSSLPCQSSVLTNLAFSTSHFARIIRTIRLSISVLQAPLKQPWTESPSSFTLRLRDTEKASFDSLTSPLCCLSQALLVVAHAQRLPHLPERRQQSQYIAQRPPPYYLTIRCVLFDCPPKLQEKRALPSVKISNHNLSRFNRHLPHIFRNGRLSCFSAEQYEDSVSPMPVWRFVNFKMLTHVTETKVQTANGRSS